MTRQEVLLESISRAQSRFITNEDPRLLFDGLLEDLLALADSEYGFIGEIMTADDGSRFLKTHAITNIAWNDETRRFYEENAPSGLEFRNLDTLFGRVIRTGAPVVTNDPSSDPHAAGIPDGHPPLDRFLGLPFYSGRSFVGMVGIANRSAGYDQAIIDELQPFLATCANIIEAYRSKRERRRAEHQLGRSEALSRAVLENIADGIITIGDDGGIFSANPAAERIFGYRECDLIGRNVSLLMPSPHRERHDEYIREYLETGIRRIIGIGREVTAVSSDGSEFPLELSVTELQIEGRRLFTGVGRDITERKEVDRLKNEFVSVVSHELRTPLTSIRGSLGLLEGGALGQLSPRVAEMVGVARSNSDRLTRLINDILDLEKLNSSGFTLQPGRIEPSRLIEGTITSLSAFAEDQRVRLVAEPIPEQTMTGDHDRLSQVLTNLVSNAIKHSGAGAEVTLAVAITEDEVRFSVSDTGPGIPAAEIERIFDRFYQIDGSDTRTGSGTGLGLAIAQSIVEQHGGSIGVDSTEGLGSCFYFTVPLEASVEPEPALEHGGSAASGCPFAAGRRD